MVLTMHSSSLWPVQRAYLHNSVWQQQECIRPTVRGSVVACRDSSSSSFSRQHPGPSAAAASVAHAAPTAESQPGVVEPHPAARLQAPSKQAILFRRRARDARRAGNAHLAYELLREGLQQHPSDTHLTVAAASAAAKLGLVDDALQLISPVLQQQPNNPYVLAAAAAAYQARGDVTTARRCYETATAAAPANEVILQAWGVLEASAGRADAARALFKQAIAMRPQHMPTYVAWANMEAQAGNVQEARALHREAHDANPMSAPNLHVSHSRQLAQLRH
jgi:tetratricopeptide (TPR) repeat protein